MQPIAHAPEQDGQEPHFLLDHLVAVERHAACLAAKFDSEDWGGLVGRWHDLGKFSQDFQKYIRGASGYEAHLVDAVPGRVNHSSAGALLAMEKLGALGRILAYLIAGHHAGLPDWFPVEDSGAALENRLRDGLNQGLLAQATELAPKELWMRPNSAFTRKGLADCQGSICGSGCSSPA